jgi:hypothetical protein
VTRPVFDDTLLDSLRELGDPEADDVVADLFGATGDATSAFRSLVVLRKEQMDPKLAEYLAARDDPPTWAKQEQEQQRIAAGQECFAEWGAHVFTALYAAALPTAYACWRGVQVLGMTARLETDAKRRLNETAQFHLDVMERGGLEFGARGFSDVRHVRLMHAAVRWLIRNDERAKAEWDPSWGTPINQEDLLETLLTFTEVVFEVFDRTGVEYNEAEADNYLRTWSLIGFHLGVRPDLLPLDRAQTRELMPRVRQRQFRSSDAGKALTAALLDQAQRLCPRGLRGMPATTMRWYVGDATADLLGVPRSDWTRVLFGPLAEVTRRLSAERLHRRFLTTLSSRIGFGMLELAVRAERFGGRPAFQVPTSLATKWKFDPPTGPDAGSRSVR